MENYNHDRTVQEIRKTHIRDKYRLTNMGIDILNLEDFQYFQEEDHFGLSARSLKNDRKKQI